jgi:hypothetical protein
VKPEDLVRQFADSTEAQSRCIDAGDPTTGNKHAKKRIQAFKRLREQGDAGRDALKVLLADKRPDVRVMAAAYLLRHCHSEARAVLEEAAASAGGLVGFGAAQALLRWQEGTWALDPAEG